MSGDGGGPPQKICPIISAVSELKQFSDYPKCQEGCGWYDDHWKRCAVRSIATGLQDLDRTQNANQATPLDYSTRQDLESGIRALGQVLTMLVERIGS